MKTTLLFIIGLSLFAEDKPPAPVHILTGDERAAIYKALYEQSQQQAAMQRANAVLTAALAVCGKDAAVGQDDKTGDIKCVSATPVETGTPAASGKPASTSK